MTDPTFLLLLGGVFIILGLFSISSGIRRLRSAKANGQHLVWYKQVNLLTGIEYILLAMVFMMSLSIRDNVFPGIFKNIIIPFYLLILLSSAVIAGFVIRQSLLNARAARQSTSQPTARNDTTGRETIPDRSAPVDDAERIQRRRSRRQKAAAARRRHAGKA
ncbi:MAG: hypothetical protein M3Z24_04470 [Chloroflexota bacterium]|nr:hypothetical protein [Chloroflexota bacterium]